jgi:hypothetical protein
MPELPDDIYEEVTRLGEQGNACANDGDFDLALSHFQKALAILPSPTDEPWQARMWLLTAIGDMHFRTARFSEGRAVLMEVVQSFDEGRANPFVRLRLGQCMLELGEEKEATNWLAGAFLSEGNKLFECDDSKYLDFIKSKLESPPGGWPDGW